MVEALLVIVCWYVAYVAVVLALRVALPVSISRDWSRRNQWKIGLASFPIGWGLAFAILLGSGYQASNTDDGCRGALYRGIDACD